jgi:hypothetical protein
VKYDFTPSKHKSSVQFTHQRICLFEILLGTTFLSNHYECRLSMQNMYHPVANINQDFKLVSLRASGYSGFFFYIHQQLPN